jgi:hypothetical protein
MSCAWVWDTQKVGSGVGVRVLNDHGSETAVHIYFVCS